MWMPVKLGEPFAVTLYDSAAREIPAANYRIEMEENPGLFGTRYDYLRLTNLSREAWHDVRFVAETLP